MMMMTMNLSFLWVLDFQHCSIVPDVLVEALIHFLQELFYKVLVLAVASYYCYYSFVFSQVMPIEDSLV